MPTFSATQVIAAPAALVWRRIAAVLSWPEWLPTVSSVAPIDGKELAVGSSFKVVQPKLKPAVWTVSILNPGRNFVWESSSPGLRMWANHSVELLQNGDSRVRLEFRFSGLLAPLVTILAGGMTRRYLATEAESLKQRAEADARGE